MGDYDRYEELLRKQVNLVKKEAGNEYRAEHAPSAYQVKQESPLYTEQFLTEQDTSQKAFFREYKENWKVKFDGAEIDTTKYADALELQKQNANLYFFQKKERKKISENQMDGFKRRMHELSADSLGIEVKGSGNYTNDMMCGNIRLQEIEQKKNNIISEALLKVDKKKMDLIASYMPFIISLGPELETNYTDDVNDDVVITQASIDKYKDYINRVFNDPVGVINISINDAIHSYGKIPTLLLGKDVIPQRFEAVKQLRDKYKAIHDIMRSSNNDPELKKSIKDIKADPLLKDNVAFATEMYRRLDADLCYHMEKNGLSFTSDRFLDRTNEEGGAYKSSGDLTQKTIIDQKNMEKDPEKEDHVDAYWRDQITSTLLKLKLEDKSANKEKKEGNEEVKEEKKEKKETKKRTANKAAADINDGQDIIATADRISQDFDTTDDEKQILFDELKENVKAIAYAISDINHELEMARYIRSNTNAGKAFFRPELLNRMTWYIANRQQQLLNLMSRVAGYLNAMRYLTGKAALNENGAQVIRSEQENQKKRFSKDKKDEAGFGFISSDTAVVDVNTKGSGKDIVALSKSPLTFEQFKKKLRESMIGSTQEYSEVARELTKEDASLKYEFLVMEGRDLLRMTASGLKNAFQSLQTPKMRRDMYIEAVKSYMDETDILYERLKIDDINRLSDEEKNDIVEKAIQLRNKLYAINRVKKIKSGITKDYLTYEQYADNKLGQDKNFKNRSKLLTQMKYKFIFSKLQQYRESMIINHVQVGTANDEMYTDIEKKEIEAILKKNKVEDGKTKDGRSKDFFIKEYFTRKALESANVFFMHQLEIESYLRTNKRVKTFEDSRKEFINNAIELQNRQAKEKHEQKKAELKAEKERKQKEREELEKRLKEEQKKKEEEAQKKEETKEEKKEEKKEETKEEKKEETKEEKKEETIETVQEENVEHELFKKADKLETKYTTAVSKTRVQARFSDRAETDPATDSWAHSFASIINDMAGKFVVDGKMILEDKDMNDKEVFGPERNKEGEPTDYVDLFNKYIPNTAIAKTTFGDLEFADKTDFLSFVKKTLDTTKTPIMLKRKGSFVTVYGIDKNNHLLCKRTQLEDSSQMYTENPDEVFQYMETNGDVSIYWFQKTDKKGSIEEIKDEKLQVEYKLPTQIISEKEASKKIKELKELKKESHEPAPLKVKDKVKVKDPANHTQYENQVGQYCWAIAMNGMINHMAGEKKSELADIWNYELPIPAMKETKIKDETKYNEAVTELDAMKSGSKVGNPMIFGDYIFEKLPGTVIKSTQINHVPGKMELCKRRFKEELSKALEKGPVSLLRNGHFVLVYELNGNTIKVKDSLNDSPDDISADEYTVDDLYNSKKSNGDIEIVWLENIQGHEKELTGEFNELTYDEKTRQFKKNGQDDESRKASGAQDMLHRNGIEAGNKQIYDVVTKSVYVPINM